MPTACSHDFAADVVCEQLDRLTEEAHARGGTVLVLGDFNSVVGPRMSDDERPVHGGFAKDAERNQRGSKLIAWCLARRLSIVNTCFRKQDAKMVTHIRGDSR